MIDPDAGTMPTSAGADAEIAKLGWTVGKTLGEGSFGLVKFVTKGTQSAACKIIMSPLTVYLGVVGVFNFLSVPLVLSVLVSDRWAERLLHEYCYLTWCALVPHFCSHTHTRHCCLLLLSALQQCSACLAQAAV